MEKSGQMVDVSAARIFIEANWPNDPLLRQIAFNLLEKLPKVEQSDPKTGKDENFAFYGGQRGGGRVFFLEQLLAAKEKQLQDVNRTIDEKEKEIMELRAEHIATPDEMLLAGPDQVERIVGDRLKEQLAAEVWRYALVHQCYDPRVGGYRYRAVVSVVDKGLYNVMIQNIE